MMVGAGERRERVKFQTAAVDENGDRLGDWEEPGLTRWAKVIARTRGEVALEQRLQGVQPVEITILRDSATRDITTAWRALWNGKPYNIKAVAPTPDHAEIVILAQADQSNA